MTADLTSEASKMCRVPGVIFADGESGRRARIAETGIEVFEAIMSYLAVNKDWKRFKQCLHWLSDDQLRAAVTYYKTYPDEIDAAIEENAKYTPEYVYATYPDLRPTSS